MVKLEVIVGEVLVVREIAAFGVDFVGFDTEGFAGISRSQSNNNRPMPNATDPPRAASQTSRFRRFAAHTLLPLSGRQTRQGRMGPSE